MERIFAAYWETKDASVGEVSGLRPIATELGVDQAEFEKLVESDEISNELIAETDRAAERGVCGAPTFFVGDEMFCAEGQEARGARAPRTSPASMRGEICMSACPW
jgi:2-hydroxychromene-2-carboxylate isomerase